VVLVYETMVLHGFGPKPQKMKPHLVWQPKLAKTWFPKSWGSKVIKK